MQVATRWEPEARSDSWRGAGMRAAWSGRMTARSIDTRRATARPTPRPPWASSQTATAQLLFRIEHRQDEGAADVFFSGADGEDPARGPVLDAVPQRMIGAAGYL